VKNLINAMNILPKNDAEKPHSIHESLKFAHRIINSSTDAILICEADPIDEPGPRIVYVNKTFERETGYTAEEVIGKTPRILQGPKTDVAARGRMREAFKKWQPIKEDLLNYKKNGEEFWVSLSIFPIANESGWFTHWISIQHNITEAKMRSDELLTANTELAFQNIEKEKRANALEIANDAILESEVNFRFILEQSPIAIRMASKTTGLLMFVNKKYCELAELPAQDLIGTSREQFDVVDPSYDAITKKPLKKVAGQSRLVKLSHHHKTKWALASGIEMIFEGEPVYLGWFYEVTEQKNTEVALLDSQKRLNFSFEGSGDGMWEWDTISGEAIYSKQWKSMLGYDETELKDDFKEWEIRVHPDDLTKAMSDLKDYLNDTAPRYINEHRLQCKDGSYK